MIEHKLSETFNVYRLLMYKLRLHCGNYVTAVEEFLKSQDDKNLEALTYAKDKVDKIVNEIVVHVQGLKALLITTKLDLSQLSSQLWYELQKSLEQVNILHFHTMLDCLNGTCSVTLINKKLEKYNTPKAEFSQLENVKQDLDDAIKVFNLNNLRNWHYKLFTGLEVLKAVVDDDLRIVDIVYQN